jgi:hypothetical protein
MYCMKKQKTKNKKTKKKGNIFMINLLAAGG